MSKIVLLAGNGLSVALSSEFSMANITKKFFERLGVEHRRFIEYHMMDKLNLVDFEECIAIIEKLYDELHFHQSFYTNGITGEKLLTAFNLNIVEQGTMFLSTDNLTIFVGGQEHSLIRARAQRGFSVLRDQVLVPSKGQELGPIAENGQELDTIADLMNV
ncbi:MULTISPECIES: hypothetical protein [Paenibacillus]|uniref:Uncharacterized protein n=1 Tax=Paenibacillus borealis TaxID=160799 RepID=A0ABX3HC56_PAEBO|nr:hypothetical protein [Paenibacillus borealis]OMD47245.1 hypothetical protein BSK56_13765 [Paenibacillus borealis]